jgi:predicted GNAT superfamily acetyltransferase
MSLPSPTQEAAARSRAATGAALGDADDVTIRRLASLAEFLEACAIQEETWGVGFSERVPAAILNVAQRIGGVTAGAFNADGRMLGFVFGMTGVKDGRLAHWSDMLAVRVEARGHHLGDRLKHFQRECCLEIGVETMHWTFDPLVARNAHFNINRLGASASEYVPDMYGDNTGSSLHGQMPTDRLIATWSLRAAPALGGVAKQDGKSHDPRLEGATLVTAVSRAGVPSFVDRPDARLVLVQLPRDIQAVRSADPQLALSWRYATREAITTYLERGYSVTGFHRGADDELPAYLLSRAS